MAVNVGATGEDGTFYGGSHIWNNIGGDGTRLHLDPMSIILIKENQVPVVGKI